MVMKIFIFLTFFPYFLDYTTRWRIVSYDRTLVRSLWISFDSFVQRALCICRLSLFFSGFEYYLFHKCILCVSHRWRIWTGVSLFVVVFVLSITVSIIMMINSSSRSNNNNKTTPRSSFFSLQSFMHFSVVRFVFGWKKWCWIIFFSLDPVHLLLVFVIFLSGHHHHQTLYALNTNTHR